MRAACRCSSNSTPWARAYEVVEGKQIDRPLDQRHTIYLDFSFAPTPAWHLSWSWQYHSGWPITTSTFSVDTLADGKLRLESNYTEPFADRLEGYHRMDLRATRNFDVGRGQLAVFIDVFNLYNRENAQSYNYDLTFRNGNLSVNRRIEPLLPRLPTIGATWTF